MKTALFFAGLASIGLIGFGVTYHFGVIGMLAISPIAGAYGQIGARWALRG